MGAHLQRARSRVAHLSPHRGPPPFCPHIEAALGTVVRTARCAAAAPPVAGADPPPRWTLRRLVGWVHERFGLRCCRETIRAALHRLDLSWKKAKTLLGRADSAKRQAFVGQVQDLLAGAQRDRYLLVSIRTPISVMAGRRVASASGSPPTHRACRPSSPSMGSISTTKGRCGCGRTHAPTGRTPSKLSGACAPNGSTAR